MRAMLVVLCLAACGAVPDATPARQVSVSWPQGHRLYVGDSRQGVVRAFSTYDGPRVVAEGRAPGRTGILDMRLDNARGRLWVLGSQAIYVHDAATLTLRQRHPVAGGDLAGCRLSLDDTGAAHLLSVAGAECKPSPGDRIPGE